MDRNRIKPDNLDSLVMRPIFREEEDTWDKLMSRLKIRNNGGHKILLRLIHRAGFSDPPP